jgi:hypothetical protein
LRSTAVLRVTIETASLKARAGEPIDEDEDYALPIWGGVIPLAVTAGAPVPDSRVPEEVGVPLSVTARAARHR